MYVKDIYINAGKICGYLCLYMEIIYRRCHNITPFSFWVCAFETWDHKFMASTKKITIIPKNDQNDYIV